MSTRMVASVGSTMRDGCVRGAAFARGVHTPVHTSKLDGQKRRVVDLASVDEDVGVRVAGYAQLALSDQSADFGPRLTLFVEDADSAVS